MFKRKQVKANTQQYTTIRRNFWIGIGFCPTCLEGNDRFPQTQCSKCNEVCKYKQKNRKGERDTANDQKCH